MTRPFGSGIIERIGEALAVHGFEKRKAGIYTIEVASDVRARHPRARPAPDRPP